VLAYYDIRGRKRYKTLAFFFVTVGSLLFSTAFIITVSLVTTESYELQNNGKQKSKGQGGLK